MITIASWIREKDEPWFSRSFAAVGRPGVRITNARRGEQVSLLEGANALLLTGGEDISAGYLRQPVPDLSILDSPIPERDAWEFAAIAVAIERGLPIFAICKGHQVLNVALGGTLHLDISGHNRPEQKDANLQTLRYDAGVNDHRRFTQVNSSHHQALDRLGDGLVVEAWTSDDHIIEQVRSIRLPWCFGVQFHPERDADYYRSLFSDFVDAAGRAPR